MISLLAKVHSSGKLINKNTVLKQQMGQIHALALQPVERGIIGLKVCGTSKIGSSHLGGKHLLVKLPNIIEDGIPLHAYYVDSCWDRLTYL